jgi:hypothetical protein
MLPPRWEDGRWTGDEAPKERKQEPEKRKAAKKA